MNHSKVKPTTKKRAKAVLSVFLVVAILIAGAYAFLSATDSKTNVFTVGNVAIELHEIFNGKDYGKGEDPGAIGDKIENIVPGQSIEKAPYVINTGKNPAYTFIAVGIPTDTSANVYNGKGTYTAKTELDIKVKAYAIQEQYNGATNAEETWTNYFKNDMISGTASDAGIELFTLNDGTSAVTTGTHTIGSDWQEFSTPYSVNDGGNTYTYHFFKYVANNELLPVGTTTTHLFENVVFNENIGGDTPPEPVTINYLLPEDNTDTLAGEVNLAATSDIPEGYRLVESKTVMPGESIGDVYFDASMDKSTENKTGDYIDAETGEVIYSNLKLYKDTNALYTYSDAGYENVVPQKYLCYDDGIFIGIHFSYWDEVNTSNSPCTVVLPTQLDFSNADIYKEVEGIRQSGHETTTFTMTSIGCIDKAKDAIKTYKTPIYATCFSDRYVIGAPDELYDSMRAPEYDSMFADFGTNIQAFKYTLKEKYQKAKISFVVPGSVYSASFGDVPLEYVSFNVYAWSTETDSGSYLPLSSGSPVKTVVFNNGIKELDCACSSVDEISLPNTLTTLGHIATKQTELIVPDSVTKICFQSMDLFSCPNLKKLKLPKSLEEMDVTSLNGFYELTIYYGDTVDKFKNLITDESGDLNNEHSSIQQLLTSISSNGTCVICSDGFIKDGYVHYTHDSPENHLHEQIYTNPSIYGNGSSHFSCDCGYSYDANTYL